MVFSLACPASAREPAASKIKVAMGYVSEQNNKTVEPRATTIPTSYAPSDYYRVPHYWTAKNYTWSAYIFHCYWNGSFNCVAKQPFSVNLYSPNGSLIGSYTSDFYDREYNLILIFDEEIEFYVKIINEDSTAIQGDAEYTVNQH